MKKATKRLLLITTLVTIIIAMWSLPVMAENYFGKIDLVQVNSAGLRFFVRAQSLSLYATSPEMKDVLMQGYYKKSNFSLAYNIITCSGGITGKCGQVIFVSVDTTNFQ